MRRFRQERTDRRGEEIHCTYDPATRGGYAPDGRKVQGTIHWVSARHAVDAEVRLYDRLFTVPNPNHVEEGKTFLDYLNPDSLKVLPGCKLEASLAQPRAAITSSNARGSSASTWT